MWSRWIACHREVELNRRLAPDIYLGVADVAMDGEAIDHIVVMRRLPEERRLSARLDMPCVADDLRHLAHLVATFHDGADRSQEINASSDHAALIGLWEAGIDQISTFSGSVLDRDDVQHAAELARQYLAGRRPLIDRRVSDGRACDGHGDLQAEDIFMLDDGPRVLDCLEFDDRLRHGDVLGDVAFLAMDLERLGHLGLASEFLDRYRDLSHDNWPSSLAHLHIAYRAHVRAKVACLRSQQGDPDAADAARSLHCQALAHLETGRIRLVVVGGGPGTGKSTLSRDLADRLGAVVLSSDLVRDDLLPRHGDGQDRLHRGRYAPDRVEAVYVELLRRARMLLEQGESVVLDASWLDPRQRNEARQLAEQTSSMLSELQCECPNDIVASRIRRRMAEGSSASDATPQLARALTSAVAPWPEAIVIDTRLPLGDAVGLAEAVATRR